MENNTTFTQDNLARLKRDELRYLLTEELAKDSADIDEALVRLLLSELEARGADPAFAEDEDVEAACEKFCNAMEKSLKKKKKWNQRWLLKVASVVLVLGILFFALPGAAKANNVQDVLSWWSDSVFQFFSPGHRPPTQRNVYNTSHPGLQKIYDTVIEYGVVDPVVPQRISSTFELIELKSYQMKASSSVYAYLINNDRWVVFNFVIHENEASFAYEKDTNGINTFELAGVEHYLLSNVEEQVVTWVVNNVECTIATNCPEEEVYDLVKSIYTSEG